jgi:hypothetical protein
MQPRQGIILAMCDVDEHGINHVVLYGGAEGLVTDMLGSYDAGPFSTNQEVLNWLVRNVDGWTPPLSR